MATRAQKVGTKRPWRIEGAPHPPRCLAVLDELATDLGLELAMLARHVFLSAQGSVTDGNLFHEYVAEHLEERRRRALAEAPADMTADLRTLMDAVSHSRLPTGGEVAGACAGISEWAAKAGLRRTAAVFAEAGAAALPEDAKPAFLAARANRVLRELWRAEVFYRRAIRYASRSLNWDIYVRAHLGLGRLMADSGRRDVAEELYSTAASVAFTEGQEWLAAQTYHDLLVLHFDSGNVDQALEYAQKALELYPVHNERFPIAVHDFASVLIAAHCTEEALPLLAATFRAPLDPQEQVLVSGTLARAAGTLGRDDLLAVAETRLLQLAPHHDFHAAFSMMNLAYGVWALGEWDRACHYAERAIQIAAETDATYVTTHGPELLARIRASEVCPRPALHDCGGKLAADIHSLAKALAQRVSAWHNAPGFARWSAGQNGPRTLGPV